MTTDPAVQAAKDPGVAFYLELDRHKPDEKRGGCTCGFCSYSADHVAIMAWRAVTPLIRAQALTEAADAIEAESERTYLTVPAVAALVRGLGEETENA